MIVTLPATVVLHANRFALYTPPVDVKYGHRVYHLFFAMLPAVNSLSGVRVCEISLPDFGSNYCSRTVRLNVFINVRLPFGQLIRELFAKFAQSKSVSNPKNLKIHSESLKALQEACNKALKYPENP